MIGYDDLADGAQPICPACGVTTNPVDGADECRECGWRVEYPPTPPHPGFGEGLPDIDDWR